MGAPNFPAECPVVEWTNAEDETFFKVGELFEIVGIDVRPYSEPLNWEEFERNHIFRRVRDGRLWAAGTYEVRALTKTAKEMLRMIKINREG